MGKLPEEFKKKWVEALRSGEYKQCTNGSIRIGGAYCCLGVANIVYNNGVFTEPAYQSLPESIADGFRNKTAVTLMDMNDGTGKYEIKKSFSEIADYIEENL